MSIFLFVSVYDASKLNLLKKIEKEFIYDKSYELMNENLKTSAPLTAKEGYAVVVGISDYPGTDLDLWYCDDDALCVYSMLINNYNFKPENVIYLQDSSATQNEISSAFDQIASQINSDDVFFFYYSGHGGFGTETGPNSWVAETPHNYPNNYDNTWSVSHPGAAYMRVHFYRLECEFDYDFLLCGDSDVASLYYYQLYSGNYGYNFWSAYLPVSEYYLRFISDSSITYYGFKVDSYEAILDDGTHYLCSYDSLPDSPSNNYLDSLLDSKLDSINCADKYIVVDSCHSGGIIPEVQQIGRYIMTACRDNESSLESSELYHGVFSYYFLNSLENATDSNGDGVRSMEECFSYVYSNTESYSSALGYTHHPQQYDGISGDAVLETAFGYVSLIPSGNTLSYSFTVHGTGLIEELKIVVYNKSIGINSNISDLTTTPASDTGFGNYSGVLQLNGFSGLSGYGIYAKVSGSRFIKLNVTNSEDSDSDTLDDAYEIMLGLNPESSDTDNDGLDDNIEHYGVTDPNDADTDNDGLNDGSEVLRYNTDPINPDTDGDGYSDGLEVAWGTDPLDPRNSLTTIFLNIAGSIILIFSISVAIYTLIIKQKYKKDRDKLKVKFTINKDQEHYNILSVQKTQKPKPVIPSYSYKPSYTQSRPSYSVPTGTSIPISIDKLKNIRDSILYRMPLPKNSFSDEGKKALMVANMAFDLINKGDFTKGFEFMINALTLGVPEPINSQIKKKLIDAVNRGLEEMSSGSQDQSTSQKICSHCGRINKITHKFCVECGREL